MVCSHIIILSWSDGNVKHQHISTSNELSHSDAAQSSPHLQGGCVKPQPKSPAKSIEDLNPRLLSYVPQLLKLEIVSLWEMICQSQSVIPTGRADDMRSVLPNGSLKYFQTAVFQPTKLVNTRGVRQVQWRKKCRKDVQRPGIEFSTETVLLIFLHLHMPVKQISLHQLRFLSLHCKRIAWRPLTSSLWRSERLALEITAVQLGLLFSSCADFWGLLDH